LRSLLVTLAFLTAFGIGHVAVARLLRAIFPRRAAWVWAALALGNLMLLGLPVVFFAHSGHASALLRTLLGPPFIIWQGFVLVYGPLSILGAAAWLAAHALRATRARFTAFWRAPTLLVLTGFAALIVLGVPGALVPLAVRDVEVDIPGLPAEFDGYRIALLSDLHVGLFARTGRLQRIVAATNALDADVITIAGDLVDDEPIHIPKLVRGLAGLRARDGVHAVLGNHDIYGGAAPRLAARPDLPFRLLVNESVRIRRGAAILVLAGLGDPAAAHFAAPDDDATARFAPDWDRALAGTRPGDIVVALAHDPALFDEAAARGLALTLSGHTHGGQLGFHRLHWSLAGLFLPRHMGFYRDETGASALYVTTGAGYWVLPVRVGVIPEIIHLTLRRPRTLTRP